MRALTESGAVATATPAVRVDAVRRAARLAADSDPARAAELAAVAVRLLPAVFPRQLRRADQQHGLGRFSGLAGQAAALALNDPARPPAERARIALQLLETGRGVLFGQALDTRDDLARLRRAHPALADDFTRMRDLLDDAPASRSDRSLPTPGPDAATRMRDEARDGVRGDARDRHRLAAAFEGTLERIRAQDGFAAFALPPPVEELTAQARDGQTALGHSEDLLDEAIHLASAFQLAGYPHVIATLWEVNDRVAATAADLFYGRLRGPDGRLDVDRAADALHHTVRELRDRYEAVPGLWAAYLHTGA